MKCEVLTVLSYLDPLYPCHLSGQVVFKEVRSFDRDVIIGQVKRMFLFYHVSYQVCINDKPWSCDNVEAHTAQ